MAIPDIVTGAENRIINGQLATGYWDGADGGIRDGAIIYDNDGLLDGDPGYIHWDEPTLSWVKIGSGKPFVSSDGDLSKAQRIGNTIIGVRDAYTGEYISYNKVTLYGDGTTMTDAKQTADGGILYIKVGSEYFRRFVPGGNLSVMWYGAKNDNSTDNTTAFNACAGAVRASTGWRMTLFIPEGRFITGKVDITGCFVVRGSSFRTTVTGLAGQDIFYWKGYNETGYIACTSFLIENMTINIDDSIDVSTSYNRIGMGGEYIGNAAVHTPVSIRVCFNNILMGSVNAPASGPGNKCCGWFSAGAAYAPIFSGANNWQGLDYPLIIGTSETYTPIKPAKVTSNDGTTFTAANAFTTNMKVALIYDINDGTLSTLNPRSLYYAVNVTSGSFQLSATSGGSAISFSVTGSPQIFAVPCGSDSIEYANDEWAWAQLRVTGKRVSFSVANLAESATGHLVMQSNGVSCRILNFPSANRQYSVHVHMSLLDTEGPAYTATLTNKEYARIEGEYIIVENGPYMAASTTGSYITIASNNSMYRGILISNTGTTSPVNYLNITGHRNDIWYKADQNESNIVDIGENNISIASVRPSGDSLRAPRSLGPKSINKIIGGFWPDWNAKGGYNITGYQSNNILFYPASQQLWYTSGILSTDISYLTDSTLETGNYVRKSAAGQLAMPYPHGSNKNTFTIGRYFPAGKWKFLAKIRSLTSSQSVTMAYQKLSGTTGAATVTLSKTITTSWSIIDMTVDCTGASSDIVGQLYITSITEGFDLAYFQVIPFDYRTLSMGVNFGPQSSGSTVDCIIWPGNGTPEGVVTARVSSLYLQMDGTAGACLWVKQSGTGNTGWVALA